MELETPKQAARRLTSGQAQKGFTPTALYEYQDATGQPIFWRIRLDKGDEKYVRPMHCNGNGWELKEPKFEGGKPLYRLPELAKSTNAPVWIVEGEKCVDVLTKAGVVAVTSGAADSAKRADWAHLKGREVVIWPDNDPAGLMYASNVKEQLKGITDRIQLVDVSQLGLSEKGDVANWLDTHSSDELSSLPMVKSQVKDAFSGAITVCMADVQPEPIQWLWPSRIALGKVTLIAGDPGLGKSIITVTLATHVTIGAPWPVERSDCPQGSVVMLSAEDDPGDTIRPRLDAAGADVSRVHSLTMIREVDREGELKSRSFNLAKDVEALDQLLGKMPDCRLITIDPISAYLGGTDSHNNADIRALLTPLAAMASKHKVAVVVVTHLNKSSQANALYRASGSLAFVAAARAVFAVAKDPDNPDRRLFLPIKNNLGDDKTGYAYQIATADNDAPVIQWEPETVEVSLEEIADAVTERKQRPNEQIKGWLQGLLSGGEVLQKNIQQQAEAEGYSWRTVRRVKKDMGIKSSKHRFDGQWTWELPKAGQDLRYLSEVAADEGGQTPPAQKVDAFDKSGPLQDTKKAKTDEGGQKTGRGEVATFDASKYPDGLLDAASTAVSGLNVTAGQVIADLVPGDYQDFIDYPETARNIAEKMAFRK